MGATRTVEFRTIFAIALTGAAYVTKPFSLSGGSAIALGLLGALSIIYFEYRLKTATLKRLIGAAIGSIMGIIGAVMISHVLGTTEFDTHTLSFIKVFILFLMTYVGLVVGANKGDFLNLAALGGIFGGETSFSGSGAGGSVLGCRRTFGTKVAYWSAPPHPANSTTAQASTLIAIFIAGMGKQPWSAGWTASLLPNAAFFMSGQPGREAR